MDKQTADPQLLRNSGEVTKTAVVDKWFDLTKKEKTSPCGQLHIRVYTKDEDSQRPVRIRCSLLLIDSMLTTSIG